VIPLKDRPAAGTMFRRSAAKEESMIVVPSRLPQAPPISATMEHLRALLGQDTVLLPIPYGEKGPAFPGWQTVTVNQTRSVDYLAQFTKPVNIGVLLGKPSGGLCSIDIDLDEEVERFLQANPRLKTTLRTRGARGCNLWVRILGEHPGLKSIKTKEAEQWGEWRADGGQTVIHGRHPSGCEYSIVNDAPPVELKFADIVWPAGLMLPWVESLTDKFGRPFVVNDQGNVTGLNERYWAALHLEENRLLYEPCEREFYQYEGETGLWRPVTAERLAEKISTRLFRYRKEQDCHEVEKLIKLARIKPVVDTLRGMAERRDVFASKPRMIHCANGVVRFCDSGDVQFSGFAPDDYSRNRSPLEFREDAECPRFINELLRSAMDPADMDLVQKWAGGVLYGVNLPQRILILDGTPGGGKSTFAAVITALVGRENCYQLRTDCLTERFETYRYRSKTLLVGADVPGSFLMERGAPVLKALVGGDLLSCEGKGLNGDFAIRGMFNVMMTCNSRLQVRLEGDTGAWRRRLLIVRYENAPPARRVQNFGDVLIKEEGPGILRWALQGLIKALLEFNEFGDFRLTDGQQARVEGLLAESESVFHFLKGQLLTDEEMDVSSAELSEAYVDFCAGRGWNAVPTAVAERQFTDLILRLFQTSKNHCVKRDGKNVRGWKGVRLKA
jgi:phage/plasmid-associated DNA primase